MHELNGRVFRVGGVDYAVELSEKISDRHNLLGQVIYKDAAIVLDSTMSQSRSNDVLVHELIHAMFFEAGYMEHDEEMISRLTPVLHGMLRDNDFGFIREKEEVK